MIKIFFKNSFIYTIGTILTRGISILLVPIYTRYLSPSEYGIIDLFVILASLISLTVALEINQAVVRFYQDTTSEKEKMQYVSTAFMFTVFAYLLYLILSFVFSDTFTIWLLDDLVYENIFLLATGAIVTKGLFYFTQGQLKWQILPRESITVSIIHVIIVAIVAVYLLVIENMKVESIFIGQIVGNIIGMFISIYYTKKSYNFVFVYKKFKEMVAFSYPLVFSGIAIFVALFIDRIAIKYFLGLDELGIYGLAYRFAAITSLVMIGFQSSLSPLIYKYYKEERTPQDIVKLFNIFVLFALFVITGSILFSKEVIVLMSTEAFYDAAPIIPILVMAIFFINMYIFVPGLAIAKKTKIVATISIVGALLNSALNFIFIPMIGLEGAAYATLISAIIIFIIRVKMSQKYYNIPFIWKNILISFIIVVVGAFGFIALFDNINLVNISIKVLFMCIILLIVASLLLGLNSIKIYIKKRI